MKITRVETWRRRVGLTQPYSISRGLIDAADLFFVRLHAGGEGTGHGSATPSPDVTGEALEACAAALAPAALSWLEGEAVPDGGPDRLAPLLAHVAERMTATPAARAAVDMALHDLQAAAEGRPLADLLGRCHDGLPTSVTLGILPPGDTIRLARKHLAAGFTHLKVKVGRSWAADADRLRRLRRDIGPAPRIRVDANQGYDLEEARRLGDLLEELDLELAEQPLPASRDGDLLRLPQSLRRRVAADESLLGPAEARALAGTGAAPPACGIFNIKLMKCGGIAPAREIAAIAGRHGVELMWGCNDESVISIAAALHTAYASPATRYLDLDGSFDLALDPAAGGFRLEGGRLYLLDRPGLGVSLDKASDSAYP